MSDLDVAKALASDSAAPYARVHYGTVTEDRQPVYKYDDEGNITGIKGYTAQIRIDGYTGECTMAVETYVKRNDRVQIVTDPTGRYLVHAMKSEVEQIEAFEQSCITSIEADLPIAIDEWTTNEKDLTPVPHISLHYGDGLAVPNTNNGNLLVNYGDGLTLGDADETTKIRPLILGDHASEEATYGVGNKDNYGHVKITSDLANEDADTALSMAGAKELNEKIDEKIDEVGSASNHSVATCVYMDTGISSFPNEVVIGDGIQITGSGENKSIVVDGGSYAVVSGFAEFGSSGENLDGRAWINIEAAILGEYDNEQQIAAVATSHIYLSEGATPGAYSVSFSPAIFELSGKTTFSIEHAITQPLFDIFLQGFYITVERWD